MSQSTGPNPGNTTSQSPMPFEPSSDFDRQVYEQWLAGPPSSQQTVTPGCPASTAINNRIDSGIEVRDSQGPQNQNINDSSTNPEEQLSSHAECPNPAACELSPDMASTMRRFAVPHKCAYLEAKDMLVDKIVLTVMTNAAPRIMEILQEELDKRAAEKLRQEENDESGKRPGVEGEILPKM